MKAATAASAPSSAGAGTEIPEALQNLSIHLVEEIHVRASLPTTFRARLEAEGAKSLRIGVRLGRVESAFDG